MEKDAGIHLCANGELRDEPLTFKENANRSSSKTLTKSLLVDRMPTL